MFRSTLSQSPTQCQQPDPSPDADATLRAARNAVRSERARQARAAAWLCEFRIDVASKAQDERAVATWLAERDALLVAADALDAGGAR